MLISGRKTRNEPLECQEKRLVNRHKCVKKKTANTTVANEVRKFHAAVSEGPMYICSCCDQLWYKHSVTTAEKLRLCNPSVIKYLLSKLSVDDMDWVSQSCYKHLQKNKILPVQLRMGCHFQLNLTSLT